MSCSSDFADYIKKMIIGGGVDEIAVMEYRSGPCYSNSKRMRRKLGESFCLTDRKSLLFQVQETKQCVCGTIMDMPW